MIILIADDLIDIRNLVKISLEENGYTVLAAQNGKDATGKITVKNLGYRDGLNEYRLCWLWQVERK